MKWARNMKKEEMLYFQKECRYGWRNMRIAYRNSRRSAEVGTVDFTENIWRGKPNSNCPDYWKEKVIKTHQEKYRMERNQPVPIPQNEKYTGGCQVAQKDLHNRLSDQNTKREIKGSLKSIMENACMKRSYQGKVFYKVQEELRQRANIYIRNQAKRETESKG